MNGGRYNINAKNIAINKVSVECGMSGRGTCLVKYNEKACIRCNEVFKPSSSRHVYCGSWKTKNTCAYIVYYLSRRVRHYGVTIEYVEDLYEKQSGMCAICGESMPYDSYKVDHSHVTGKVRGLLCHPCNVGLGYTEKEGWLNRALKYLEMNKIRNILKVV
jgi:hypothetical protein